jgi:hypothetical protein
MGTNSRIAEIFKARKKTLNLKHPKMGITKKRKEGGWEKGRRGSFRAKQLSRIKRPKGTENYL